MYIVVRTPGDAAATASSLGRVLRDIDPALPLFNIQTMEERIAGVTAANRFNAVLLTTLAAIGLVLSMVGIYGVIAYFVGQRTAELGVRLALGATPAQLVRLVIYQALRPVVVGLTLGIAGSLVLNDLLAAQLYGVTPRDPLTIAAASFAFIAVAAVASWVPARRAALVHPAQALNTA
jgi:ABC-type antimicrobial peptide transport system permease subunit